MKKFNKSACIAICCFVATLILGLVAWGISTSNVNAANTNCFMEIATDVSDNFVVTHTGDNRNECIAILESDEYLAVVEIDAEQYATWNTGDVVFGRLLDVSSNPFGKTGAKFFTDDAPLEVKFYAHK